jgi:hypothetical protein
LGGVTTQNTIGCPDFRVVIGRNHAVGARGIGTGLNADEFLSSLVSNLVDRVIACFDLIDCLIGAVGQEVAPDLRIDKANIEGSEATRHGYLKNVYKSFILRESRSVN